MIHAGGVLEFNVARERAGRSLPAAIALLLGFLAIDLGFLGSNLLKIPDGGWLPVLIGVTVFTIMTTWRKGASLLAERIARATPNLETFIGWLSSKAVPRVPGTAVFFTGRLEQAVSGAAATGSARGRPARAGDPSYRCDRAIAKDRDGRTYRTQGLGRWVLPRGAALRIRRGQTFLPSLRPARGLD